MLQAVGGCDPLSKAKGRGGSRGGRYGAGVCGAARCVDSACGCAGGTTMTSCSADVTMWRLAPVLSTCDEVPTTILCSCAVRWPAAKAAADAAGWRAVVYPWARR